MKLTIIAENEDGFSITFERAFEDDGTPTLDIDLFDSKLGEDQPDIVSLEIKDVERLIGFLNRFLEEARR